MEVQRSKPPIVAASRLAYSGIEDLSNKTESPNGAANLQATVGNPVLPAVQQASNAGQSSNATTALVVANTHQSSGQTTSLSATTQGGTQNNSVHLPAEIISIVLSFLPPHARSSFATFLACTKVSRVWCSGSILYLYSYPRINPMNFPAFVSAILSDKNARMRKTPLSTFVQCLDMSELVHSSSRSLTAQLLGRVKGNLRLFIAPQASFALNSFAALGKCSHLTSLDLSLVWESIEMSALHAAISKLQNLETLYYPRACIDSHALHNPPRPPFAWPPNLKSLYLTGRADRFFITRQLPNTPETLNRLSIQNCPDLDCFYFMKCMEELGPRLKHLTVRYPMSRLVPVSANGVFAWCKSLISLHVSSDYMNHLAFIMIPKRHPLRVLDIDSSPIAGEEGKFHPDLVFRAIDNGKLPDLRSVRVSTRMGWTDTREIRQSAAELGDILEAMEREQPLGIDAGVFVIPPPS